MTSKVKPEEVKGNMTAMIDVVFLLLIFFMCAAKFKTLENKLDINLPKFGQSDEKLPVTVTPRYVTLKIDALTTENGLPYAKVISVFVGSQEVGTYLRPGFGATDADRAGLHTARNQIYKDLEARLAALALQDDPAAHTPTFLKPDLLVPSDDVVQALNAVLGAGIHDLTFAGQVSDVEKYRRLFGVE